MRIVGFLSRRYTELTGAIHNHSNYSYDCDVEIDTIIESAFKSRLDYLTLNDHHAIPDCKEIEKQLRLSQEKNGYQPIVIAGCELNDPNDYHHLLAFGMKCPNNGKTAEEYIKDIRDSSGYLFAAHPFEKRVCKDYPLYIWEKIDLLEKVDGLEIWNFSSSWLCNLHPRRNGLLLLLFPNWFVRKPFRENLLLWDNLIKRGLRISAIGSTDAHGTNHKTLFIRFRILTHKYLFGTIRTNVLLAEGQEKSSENILQALKKGNSYIVNYRLGNPYNFYAGIGSEEGLGVSFGEEIKMRKNLRFYYMMPCNATVSLIKDGETIAKQNNKYGSFPIESAGNYRLQMERFSAGWIYTNYIYVL